MQPLPVRPLRVADVDRTYLQLCGIAPRFTEPLTIARALLLSGATIADGERVHFPLGAVYNVEQDSCSCGHAPPSLCPHQLAMRIRRVAVGQVLLREVAR